MQQRCIGRHRGLDLQHMRQHLVADIDQLQRSLCNVRCRGSHCGYRMADIKHLVPRHAVFAQRAQRGGALAGFEFDVVQFREIGRRHYRLDAGQRTRRRSVNRHDPGMGMRAALDAAGEHAGKAQVGTEVGSTGDFFSAIGANRALADDLQGGGLAHVGHDVASNSSAAVAARICVAASCTARTILS